MLFYGIDPNEGVNGLYFNAIHDGRVLDYWKVS
jgi:hypothetical protein